MFVQLAHRGVTKQHATTAVGLETVFVWVNYDGVDLAKYVEYRPGAIIQVHCESKVAAIGSVGVNPEIELVAQAQNVGQWIH